MTQGDPDVEEVDEETRTRGLSRDGTIFLLRTTAVVLLLAVCQFGGLADMAMLKIQAGAAKPWAEKAAFYWGEWGFSAWRPFTQSLIGAVLVVITAGLFVLAARGLKRRKRWSVWMGMAITAILLALNTILLIKDIWEVWDMLNNETGKAFGKMEPVWRDVPLVLPAVLILLEIVLIVLLRKLSKLRVDVLH